MSRSLIQTTNLTSQTIAENGIISLGSVMRRFGCDLALSGNAVEVTGTGYYTITCNVSVLPTASGNVTVALYDNGAQIPGAVAYGSVSTASNPVTLPIETTIRRGCCCEGSDSITAVLLEGAGVVSNVSVRIEKA